MKKILLLWVFLLMAISSVRAQQQVIVQDSIVGNVTWTNDKTYLLRGYVYIVSGASLTIQPGTLIFGEKSTKGSLIAEPGGKLWAIGTPTQPIVFTSQAAPGSRDRGDWGGVILCGRAPINQNNTLNGGSVAGGDAQIEGGPRTHYGGTNEHDTSGALSYVRVEFPGVAFSPNNEINGITFGGVGDGTQIDHTQVSYSGDDSYEWFGGSVRGKYIIAFRGIDDEWDTDFGWHGKLQFCVSLRDPNIADQSGSNGFESDNDANGDDWNPHTSAVISNLTVVGPMADTSVSANINPLFRRGAHLRRSTQESIYNTIVMGWPDGLLIDGDITAGNCLSDSLQIRNCIWAGLRPGHDFLKASVTRTFDPAAWFKTGSYNNQAIVQPWQVLLNNAFSLTAPNFVPIANSPAIGAASFNNWRLKDAFFTPVSYVGAFDPAGPRWDSGWVNYDPQNTSYVATITPFANTIVFPPTAVGAAYDSTVVIIRNTGHGPAIVTGWHLSDTTNFRVVSALPQSFALPIGSSKTMTIRFLPTDTNQVLQNLVFTYDGSVPQTTIFLQGKAKASGAPAISVYPNATKFDFALVRVGDSATGSIIVTNSGTADLQISSAAISGVDASQFTLVNSGNMTVAPTKTGTIFVRFKPSSIGLKNATLTITHNAGAATAIALLGTGVNVPGQDVLQDSIVGNVTLTNDRTWLVKGYLYVVNGATLNIQAGTVIYGEKSTKGAIIVEPGAKIYAVGTPEHPIVFTSQMPPGQRDRGDWGGVILCGRAPINQNNTLNGGTFNGGDAQIEGGPRTHYGGPNEHDNSGIMRYCRIEFPGVAFSPNNEINGLTFGGVGDSTQIDHIQVSYSGDDSYEWFGGSVWAKFLIALRGIDDEWDTDFGWHGKLQFCVSLRDPNIADQSGSNGFESDNDASGHDWNPHTTARISNLTVVGPMSDTSKSASINPLFRRGAHLRRTTHESIYNTIDMGWPDGILIDGDLTAAACLNDSLQIRNCIWAGLRPGHDFLKASVTRTFDPVAWYKTASYKNQALVQPAEVKLTDPFNLTNPNFRPIAGSPAINGADFTTPALANDPFFTNVSYIGAFDPNGPRWDSGWTNYDPQNTDYSAKRTVSKTAIDFGKIKIGRTATDSITITNTGLVPITVTSVAVTGGSVFQIMGGTSGFTVVQGATKTLYVTFTPTAVGPMSGNVHLTMRDETTADIALSAEGIANNASSVRSSQNDELLALQNTPNPFAMVTTISYNVPEASTVTLDVIDVTGRVVSHVATEFETAGKHSQMLNAGTLASGVYYVRLVAGDATAIKPIVISH